MGFSIKNFILNEIAAQIEERATGVVQDWADDVVQIAQGAVPVESGELLESIGSDVSGDKATAKAEAPYAGFVDLGHHTRSGSWVPPNPFFTNAVEQANGQVEGHSEVRFEGMG